MSAQKSYKYSEGSKTINTTKGDSVDILFINDSKKSLRYEYGFVGNSITNRNILIDVIDVATGKSTGKQITIKNPIKNKLSGLKFTATVQGGDPEDNIYFDFVNNDRLQTHYSVSSNYKGKRTVTYTGINFCEEIAASRINDTIKLGSGKSNVVFAGEGNDKIYGGNGSDVFVYGTNTSNNMVKSMIDLYYNEYDSAGKARPTYSGNGNDTIYKATSADKLVFSDSDATDLTFLRSGNNLIIYTDGADKKNKVTLSKFFTSANKLDDIYLGENNPDEADEADISIKELENIIFTGKVKMNGSEYNEAIIGSSKKDRITTGVGIDNVYAGAGNDTITLNAGGVKAVHFSGYEPLQYYDGNTSKTVKEGNDTIYIKKDTNEKLADTTLVFDGRVNPNQYGASVNGNDLIITLSDELLQKNGTITVKDYFVNYTSEYLSENNDLKLEINNISKDVRSILATAQSIHITGKSTKKNTINGTIYSDTITGGKKSDTIYTGIGDDTINAGKGNDNIHLNGSGTKTIIMTKGSGSDSLYIDDNGVNANVLLEGTSNISYSSNGTDLTINTSYGSGKKSVNDKITIKNGLSELDNVSVLGTDLESVLKSNIISISGIYNKKGKSYSFTGTKYDDTVNGTNKKDFIEVFDGNNTINVGKKGSSTIEAGVGNDTYNIKNLTSKVTIHDKAGDDVLNLSGNKYSDLNFFFNVLKNDEIIDINSNNTNLLVKDLYILDKKTITSMSKSKSVNPNKGVLIEEFFFADEENETDGAIETINVKDKGNVSELLNSSVTAITNAVKTCLNKTSYNSAYELIEKGTTSEKKELIACYVSNKNSGNELLLGHNISLLNSEIAGWKSSAPDIAPLVTDNNDKTVDIPIIIQENIR